MNVLRIRMQTPGKCYAGAGSIALAALLLVATPSNKARAQTAPSLGTAQSFAVLGSSTVTNTGPTIVTGNLGVSPGTAVTGFPPGTVVGGSIHAADAVAAQAQADNTTAYGDLASQACNTTFGVPKDIGGLTLVPGVYCFSSSAGLTGTVTLNGGGNANSVWIFKIGSTLITASDASVLLINGAQQCNVFWQVGSSATVGTGTDFVGNILALTSISLTTNARVSGRALAQNGAVTLDSNAVSITSCSSGGGGPVPPTIGESFAPPTMSSGAVSLLTITLNNPNASAANMTAPLTDNMPSGMAITGTATTTCGGTLTAPAGGSAATLTGGSIPAHGSCEVMVHVTVPGSGTFINSIPSGALQTSNGSNAGPAVATLTVNGPATGKPSVSKAFSPATMAAGGVSTLTITLTNTNADAANLTAPLTDHLPSGTEVAGDASTTCGGAVTANRGSSTVTLTGGSIPPGGSCTVTVPVTAPVAGSFFNSLAAGALQTSNGSNVSPAVATLTVLPENLAPLLSKSFSPSSVKAGVASTLTITLTNPDTTVATLIAPLTDHLPSGMVISGSASTTCGGTVSANGGSSTVTLNGGSIKAGGSCKITVPVVAKSKGNYVNSLPSGALKTSNGNNTVSAAATLMVNAAACMRPSLSKCFNPTWVKQGGSATLTIDLNNTDYTVAWLTAPLTDHFPSGMVVSGTASTTCGGSVSAKWGNSYVTLNGGSIPARGSCKVTVRVTAKNKCSYTNTLPAGALQTNNGSNASAATARLSMN